MRTFVLAVCLSYFALSLRADALRDRMDAYVRRYADSDFFSGVIRVTKGDRIIYENAFGYADRGWQVPNSLQTRFQIASLSKPMTAAAILLLGEERKLSLEDKLSKFVPDFPNGNKTTIEELLTHYSGLGDASAQPDYNEWSRFPQTTAALVERAKKIPRQSEPGTTYFYSNSNYHILAFLIEKVSGQNYGDFLEQKIFKPAGMTNTAHRARDETIVSNLANGYSPVGASGFERAPYLDWTSKTGNGSIYSTADDLLRFHRALQSGSLLKPETLKQSYGFERFIDDDATVVVLSNLYIAAPSTIAEDLGAMLFDQPVNRDVPRPIHVNGADLKRFVGTFRFGDDYFVKNAVVRVEPQMDHLDLNYPATGFSIALIPIEGDRFFDRNFWSFVRFDGDKLIYRNNDKDYIAVRQ